MENKLTDSEIVKALECCLEASGVNCGKCPYCDNCVTDENTSLMMIDVLDLLNRLQADVDNYKQIAENQQKIILDKAFENKKLKAEIERLQNSIAVFTNNAVDFANEIDRHKKDKEEAFLFAANIVESEKIVIANTKAEAYKEFAERLKQLKYQSSDWSHGEHPFVVEESDIDDTLYELVGEDNVD